MKLGILGSASNVGHCFLDVLVNEGLSANLLQHSTHLDRSREHEIFDNEIHFLANSDRIISFIPIWYLSEFLIRNKCNLFRIKNIICLSSASLLVKKKSSFSWERDYASQFSDAESQISKICYELTISCTFVRPSMIWGYNKDKNISTLLRFVSSIGFLILPTQGLGYRYPIHVSQLSLFIASLLTRSDLPSSFVLLGPQKLSYHEMCCRLFHWQNLRPVIFILPRPLVYCTTSILSFLTGRKDLNIASFERLNESFDYHAHSDIVLLADGNFSPLTERDLPYCTRLAILTNKVLSVLR
jgi:hypothetical protein